MASIYVHLSEEVKNKREFKEVKKASNEFTECFVGDIRLFRDHGEFFITLYEVGDDIPETLRDVVKRASLHDWQPYYISRRLCGKYSHESASAIVDAQTSNKQAGWSLRIIGDNLKDVKELYYKIRSGQILPFENWEAPQITKPISKQCFLKRFFKKIS